MPVIRVATSCYVVDLGVFLATDIEAESANLTTLIDAPVGSVVQIVVGEIVQLAGDNSPSIEIDAGASGPLLIWGSSDTDAASMQTNTYGIRPYIETGDPVLLVSVSGDAYTAGAIHLKALVVEAGY